MPSKPLQVLWTRKSRDSSSSVLESPRSGLKKLVDGTDPTFDIVAVHGSLSLEEKHENKWTAENGVNWLQDLLPSDIPQARIFSWGYDAKAHDKSTIKSPTLYDHARNLVSDLCRERRVTETQRRPIVFVAHSLGGIVVKCKKALIHSDAARAGTLGDQHSIKLSTYGILFMGTPHQGSGGVDLQKLALRAAKVVEGTDTGISKHLNQDPGWLRQLEGQYEPINDEFVTIFAYEMVPTLGKMIMVPKSSAILPGFPDTEAIAIPADHINMVRFSSREDEMYQMVSGHLITLGRDAPEKISVRWEQHEKYIRGIAEMKFYLPFSLSGVPEAQTFVGREKELTDIRQALQGNGPQRKVVVLQGLGGIGKTQLAVKFLKEEADNYSAMVWLDGKTEDTLKQSVVVAANRLYKYHPASALLKGAVESKDIDDTVAAFKRWFSAKGNHQWLLVFDNVDNPILLGVEDSQAYDVQSYIPETHQGSIIITTRSSRLDVGKIVPISKLGTEESIEILQSTSRRDGLNQDPHVQDLVKELDGLPLALATTGAYLRQVSTRLEVYLRNYRASWKKLQTKSPKLMSYQDRTLYTTWDISLTHIEMQSKSAGQLLRLLGYFDSHDIWYELLAAGDDGSLEWFSNLVETETNFNEAIRILSDLALIESTKGSDGYSMHSCVHAWIAHVLNAERDISMAKIATYSIGVTVPDKDTPRNWEVERRLIPHAQKCLERVRSDIGIRMQDGDGKYLYALNQMGGLYRGQGKVVEAEAMYERALEGYEQALGPDHISTLSTVNNLGNLYRDQDKMVEAEAMYLRALEGKEKALGPDHTSTLSTVNNLAVLYSDQGKMVEAEAMYFRALEGKEKALGPDHTSTLDTVNNLGNLYRDQEKLVEAEVMYRRALDGYEKTLGPEHTSTFETVHDLGLLYKTQGKRKKAALLLARAIHGFEKVLGPDHESTLEAASDLEDLYQQEGRVEDAELIRRRWLSTNS